MGLDERYQWKGDEMGQDMGSDVRVDEWEWILGWEGMECGDLVSYRMVSDVEWDRSRAGN